MVIAVEVEDVLWSMTSYEKKEMLNALFNDMDIPIITECLNESGLLSKVPSLNTKETEDEFNKQVLGLLNNRFKLTNEEEEMISKISQRINP
jgi:hypothetical protein